MSYAPSLHSSRLPELHSEAGLASYLRKIFSIPLLTQEQEHNLAVSWFQRRDQEAAQQLVLSHLRLVPKLAARYKNYGLPFMDLISEGNIGLMQAVRNFDPHKGFRLVTYAVWWIRASIQDYILRSWSLVKIATTALQKRLFSKLHSAKLRIGAFDRAISREQSECLAKELGATPQEIEEFNVRMLGDVSMESTVSSPSPSSSGSLTLQDTLASADENPEEVTLREQERRYMRTVLARAMRQLSKRDRFILWARRLRDGTPRTLESLSLRFGVSRERIRQLEEQAFAKVKELCKKALPYAAPSK